MKNLICIIPLTLLTGCATAHKETLPPELLYQPPSSGQTATIQGSMKPRYAKLVGDRIAYIVNIDGKRLPLEKKQQYKNLWDKSYPISTGEHTLTVQYNMAGWYTLPVKISFNAQANHDYQLDFATDIGTSLNSGNSYTDFWITDKATNKPISEVVRAQPVPDMPSYSVPIIIHNTPNVTIRH